MRVVRERTTSRITKQGTTGAVTVSEADDYIRDFYNTNPLIEDKEFDFIGCVLGHMNDEQKKDLMNNLVEVYEYSIENGLID